MRVTLVTPIYDKEDDYKFIGFDVTYEISDEDYEKGFGKNEENLIKGIAKIRTTDKRVSKEITFKEIKNAAARCLANLIAEHYYKP
jgi:hypothetical protein